MNALVNTDSVSESFAPADVSPFNPARTDSAQRIKRAIDSIGLRTLGRYTCDVLQVVGWVLAALYLLGAGALAVALLYHTFVR
jgi:hypothetical protein